jgi:hypothetical protein
MRLSCGTQSLSHRSPGFPDVIFYRNRSGCFPPSTRREYVDQFAHTIKKSLQHRRNSQERRWAVRFFFRR